MTNLKQPLLPFDFSEVGGAGIDKYEKLLPRKSRFLNMNLMYGLKFSSQSHMPIVQPYSGAIPHDIVSFNKAISFKNYNAAVHFYTYDYEFERLWNQPFKYLNLLRRFKCVIGPDFSQFLNCPRPMRQWNNYRNKFLMAWMQSMGLAIIPNVTWSDPDSYNYCFDGLPQHSIIAINSMGVNKNPLCRNLWLRGYRMAIKKLEPVSIIRYGNPIQGELAEISVYFENDNLNYLRNGR